MNTTIVPFDDDEDKKKIDLTKFSDKEIRAAYMASMTWDAIQTGTATLDQVEYDAWLLKNGGDAFRLGSMKNFSKLFEKAESFDDYAKIQYLLESHNKNEYGRKHDAAKERKMHVDMVNTLTKAAARDPKNFGLRPVSELIKERDSTNEAEPSVGPKQSEGRQEGESE